MSKMIDITGQVFHRLRVLSRVENSNQGRARWLCECECGNRKVVFGSHLRNGSIKSCGCLQKEKASITMKTTQKLGATARMHDLTGQIFGYLTVICRDTTRKENRPYWLCQCKCGNKTSVLTQHLLTKRIQSCGCLGSSVGEAIITDILVEHNIPFQREYKFSDLKDKSYLRYDFAIFNDEGKVIKLIEYDGRQHTDEKSCWYNEKVVLHDQMKTEYAEKNNIPLIRISYKDQEHLSLDFLGL